MDLWKSLAPVLPDWRVAAGLGPAEVGPAPGKSTAAPATPALSPEVAERTSKLLAFGVRPDRLGTPSALASVERPRRALELLAWIRGGGGMRGAPNRIIHAWNAGQDGLDNRVTYPTILHYVTRLDDLAQASMGVGYDKALEQMPRIRLAGAGVGGTLPVHPRAVYFAASAQVGMDVRAGVGEGKGHYVPTGGFKNLLRDLKKVLVTVSTRKAPLPGAAQAVTTVHGQLGLMLQVLAAQEADEVCGVYAPQEHREPGLRRQLLPLRTEVEAFTGRLPVDDGVARGAATGLLGLLAPVIGKGATLDRNHGSGSIDPHGPGHATGLAIDLFYGAGDGKYGHQNKAVKSEAWPFLYKLIQLHGPSVGLDATTRPASLGQLAAADAQRLSKLLHDHGEATRAELAEQSEQRETVAERATYARFKRMRLRSKLLLRERVGALARGVARLPGAHPLRAEFTALAADLYRDSNRLGAISPAALEEKLYAWIGRLLTAEVQLRMAGVTGRRADVDGTGADRSLHDVLRDLRVIRDVVGPLYQERLEAGAIASARHPVTKALTTRGAQDERPLFDQPMVMVEALADVHTGHSALQASHHWKIASAEILEKDSAYGEALGKDMAVRHAEGRLARVLGVMAESEGGRAILQRRALADPATPAPARASVEVFHASLERVVGGAAARDAMLADVTDRVITPYTDPALAGGGSKGKPAVNLLADLRDRGFYLAGPDGDGAGNPGPDAACVDGA